MKKIQQEGHPFKLFRAFKPAAEHLLWHASARYFTFTSAYINPTIFLNYIMHTVKTCFLTLRRYQQTQTQPQCCSTLSCAPPPGNTHRWLCRMHWGKHCDPAYFAISFMNVCIWCLSLSQISLGLLYFCHISIVSLCCVESPGPWFHFTLCDLYRVKKSVWFTDFNKWFHLLFQSSIVSMIQSFMKIAKTSFRQSRRNVYLPSSTWPWISCC